MVNEHKLRRIAHPHAPENDLDGRWEARGGVQGEATLKEELPLLQDVIDASIRTLVAVARHHRIEAAGTQDHWVR